MYDSSKDTLLHIKRVAELLNCAAIELIKRGNRHDQSKLVEPEKSEFDRMTPLLKNLPYGSEEYKASLKELQDTLDHHYAANSHHPQHYRNGIDGMNLFDLVEMYMDWIAAGERTEGGSIHKSLEVNKDRFGISEQLMSIFKNTANFMT